MTPVTVRFTPDASEVRLIEAELAAKQPKRPVGFSVVNVAILLFCAWSSMTRTGIGARSQVNHWVGVLEIVFAISYAFLILHWLRPKRLTIAEPSAETVLTVDDSGITFTKPASSFIRWRSISSILDVEGAFLISRSTGGKAVPILKRAIPDGGAELWATFDAKLTSERYLLRGTASQLANHQLTDVDVSGSSTPLPN